MTTAEPISRGRWIVLLLAAALVLMLPACTRTVVGVASFHAGGIKESAPPSTLQIHGSDGGEIDQLVANSVDDVMAYWNEQFPGIFGKKLQPLAGGVHSFTTDQADPIPCIPDGNKAQAARMIFYCPTEDAIAFDRDFLTLLAKEHAPAIIPLIMAHEVGHMIQMRTSGLTDKSIALEGQADCYAGVFVQEMVNGTAHFQLTSDDLSTVLGGFLLFRDQPGKDESTPGSHGSGFDRIAALQEGFFDGPAHCQSAFGDDREYTAIPYLSPQDEANKGNLAYAKILPVVRDEMNIFAEQMANSAQQNWTTVEPTSISGSQSSCAGKTVTERLYYCGDTREVRFDESGLLSKAYQQYGDFAVMQLIAVGFADALLDELSPTKTGATRFTAALCLTGVYAGDAFAKTVANQQTAGGLRLSAGDLDEAIAVLIGIGEDDAFLRTHDVDAFGRIDAFRAGFELGRDGLDQAQECVS